MDMAGPSHLSEPRTAERSLRLHADGVGWPS